MENKEKIIKSFTLLKETWQVYIKNLLKFLEVFLYGIIGVVPMFILISLFYAYGVSGWSQNVSPTVNLSLLLIGIVLFVFSLYLAIVYSVRMKVASILLLKNNFTSAKDNFKEAKPYFVKFLGVSLLVVVLIIAWCFALIIPAVIFGVYYGFATYILVAEDKRPFSAVERSYDLVRGYFWPVFGRLALVSTVGIIIYSIISKPISQMEVGGTPYIIYSVLTNIIWAVLSPYFIIYFYKIYQSLKNVNK